MTGRSLRPRNNDGRVGSLKKSSPPAPQDNESSSSSKPVKSPANRTRKVALKKSVQVKSRRRKRCRNCYCLFSLDSFPSDNMTTNCTHKSETCTACVEMWCATQLITKNWSTLEQHMACVHCSEPMSDKDVEAHAKPDTHKRYMVLKTRARLAAQPGVFLCQNSNCESGQTHKKSSPRMVCRLCQFASCVTCRIPWHEGKTCGEYSAALSVQHQSDEHKSHQRLQNAKRCPGSNCHAVFERDGGCSHMTCTRCNTQFCFECLVSFERIYAEGPWVHAEGCPLRPTVPPPAPVEPGGT